MHTTPRHATLTGVHYGDVEVGRVGTKRVHCIAAVLPAVLGVGPGQDQTVVVVDIGTVAIGHPCHLISGGGAHSEAEVTA